MTSDFDAHNISVCDDALTTCHSVQKPIIAGKITRISIHKYAILKPMHKNNGYVDTHLKWVVGE